MLFIFTFVVRLVWQWQPQMSNTSFPISREIIHLWEVGVSNYTQYPTKPPNLANPAQKPADSTPVTVNGGSSSLKPDTSGLKDGYKNKNWDLSRSDRMYIRKTVVLHRWMCFASHLLRLVEIQPYIFKIWQDLVEIQPDLFEIRPDLCKSTQSQPYLVVSGKISHSFKIFNSNRGPTGIWGVPTTRTDFIHRSTAGPQMRDPKLSGRFWIRHKPDPNRLVDRPNEKSHSQSHKDMGPTMSPT